MDPVADLGGAPGFGPVHPPADAAGAPAPPFAHPWEGRAFALTLVVMGRVSGRNIDAFRYALSRLDPASYVDDGYHGRWLHAAELMLTDSAVLAPGAVDARVRRNRGEEVTEPAAPTPRRPDYAPTGPGSLREITRPPRFAAGDPVRALPAPAGATASGGGPDRLPRYVRGRPGVIAAVRPPHVLPDTHAVFAGEHPQHVYTVAFDAADLWGGTARDEGDVTVHADLFESHLEPR